MEVLTVVKVVKSQRIQSTPVAAGKLKLTLNSFLGKQLS